VDSVFIQGMHRGDTKFGVMTLRSRRIFVIHGSHNLTDHSFNGDGLVAWGFINELANRGHQVYVATDKLDVRGPVPPNLTLAEFPRRHRNGVRHYLSYMRRARALYRDLAARDGIDVVHQMNPVVRGLSLALTGLNVPVVLGTYVGDWVASPRAPGYKTATLRRRCEACVKLALDALQQRSAAAIVLATPHALGRVPLMFDIAGRVRFMHHGVDARLYHPTRRETDPPPRAKAILYVGMLIAQKGIMTLADAFARVVVREPDSRLVVVGIGPDAKHMKARLEALNVADRVEFVGLATRQEVAGWLRACAVLCAPSFGEPYGQNVLEAMATAKPVVATNEGGHPYLLDLAGGLRTSPGDSAALADALTAVLSDPARAHQMGAHNRAVIERRNTWSCVTDELERIYERAIAEHAAKQ